MSLEKRKVANISLQGFAYDIQSLVQQGFEIDDNDPPTIWGVLYETGMIRTIDRVEGLIDRLQNGMRPKMTRAETLQVARAARGKNKENDAEGVADAD